jgi:fructokinase
MTKSFFCLGLGEVLWDLLPDGPRLGGAPANFAHHVQALGGRGGVVSCVGDDALGRAALDVLRQRGLATESVAIDPAAPTGTVTVALDAHGVPAYEITADVAWDRLAPAPIALRTMATADAVCFGTLAQRTVGARAAIHACLRAARPDSLRILDLNLRAPYWTAEGILASLTAANVLKLNEAEWAVLCDIAGLPQSPEVALPQVAMRYDLGTVALTLGARGSVLWHRGTLHHRAADSVAVVDTIGAGDSYAAVLALGLLRSMEPQAILAHAHRVAAYVCTQRGAMPELPAELRMR